MTEGIICIAAIGIIVFFFLQIQFFGWVKLPPVSSSEAGEKLSNSLQDAGIEFRTQSHLNVAGHGTGIYDISDDYRTRDVYVKQADLEGAMAIHRRIELQIHHPPSR